QFYIYNFAEHRWLERHIEPLTERERIILENSAQGLTERQISKKILRTIHSVKASKRQLFKKLEVKSTAEALEFCINHGLL
ncbi:MAG: response regulator transcription factor, partial [Bacteroidaceae bacterium]|nr:response regulator transcription factor [Bacteroidaceae bacterium]